MVYTYVSFSVMILPCTPPLRPFSAPSPLFHPHTCTRCILVHMHTHTMCYSHTHTPPPPTRSVHLHHETTQCFIRQARDFCILVNERSEVNCLLFYVRALLYTCMHTQCVTLTHVHDVYPYHTKSSCPYTCPMSCIDTCHARFTHNAHTHTHTNTHTHAHTHTHTLLSSVLFSTFSQIRSF